MKVTLTKIEGHDVLTYRYTTGPDIDFEFYQICEVGEPWKARALCLARLLAARKGKQIVELELKASPWIVDALV